MTPLQRAIAVCILATASADIADANYSRLAVEDALSLVLEVCKEKGQDTLPAFSVETGSGIPGFDGYYWFWAYWEGAPEGSVNLGSYAVDVASGDVWDAVYCHEYRSKSLRRLQDAIRLRIGVSKELYKSLRRRGPFCD